MKKEPRTYQSLMSELMRLQPSQTVREREKFQFAKVIPPLHFLVELSKLFCSKNDWIPNLILLSYEHNNSRHFSFHLLDVDVLELSFCISKSLEMLAKFPICLKKQKKLFFESLINCDYPFWAASKNWLKLSHLHF